MFKKAAARTTVGAFRSLRGKLFSKFASGMGDASGRMGRYKFFQQRIVDQIKYGMGRSARSIDKRTAQFRYIAHPMVLGTAGSLGLSGGFLTGTTRSYYGQHDWSPFVSPVELYRRKGRQANKPGMSHDNLGTDGLVLALHRVRHR